MAPKMEADQIPGLYLAAVGLLAARRWVLRSLQNPQVTGGEAVLRYRSR
jgi:phage gp29-like protein